MFDKQREHYAVEDFVADESFINYHFRTNLDDELTWRQWIEKHPEKKAIVKQAAELIDTLSLSVSDEEYNTELQKIKSEITPIAPSSNFNFPKTRDFYTTRKKRLAFGVIMSIFALFAVFGYFLFHTSPSFPEQLTKTVNHGSGPLTILLSDSTVVTLAAQGTLEYPLHFKPERRDVYLSGEALFHVRRNEKAPFKVFSGNLIATVLGTTFSFTKSADSSVIVELLKGKLSVQVNDEFEGCRSILLYPDERAIYLQREHSFYKRAVTRHADIAFHESNFNEIAARIKEVFGKIIINRSNNIKWRFTGEFHNSTAEDVIENICVVKNLTADVKSDTIYIK